MRDERLRQLQQQLNDVAKQLAALQRLEAAGDVSAVVGSAINAAAADTPLDADKFGFWDVVDAALKSVTWTNIKANFVAMTGNQTVAGAKTWSDNAVFNALVDVKAGASSDVARVGGTMYANGTVISTVGSGETNLHVYTVPASTLSSNGDYIIWEEFGTTAGNANSKTLRFYVNGTVVAANVTTVSGGTWYIRALVTRFSSTAVQVYAEIRVGAAPLAAATEVIDYAAVTTTLSSTFVIGTTGQATSNGDLNSAHAYAQYHPVNT